MLVSSEILGIKPALAVFGVHLLGFLGVLGKIGLIAPHWRAFESKKPYSDWCAWYLCMLVKYGELM